MPALIKVKNYLKVSKKKICFNNQPSPGFGRGLQEVSGHPPKQCGGAGRPEAGHQQEGYPQLHRATLRLTDVVPGGNSQTPQGRLYSHRVGPHFEE